MDPDGQQDYFSQMPMEQIPRQEEPNLINDPVMEEALDSIKNLHQDEPNKEISQEVIQINEMAPKKQSETVIAAPAKVI